MSKIGDLGLGGIVLQYRNDGYTLEQIATKLRRDYRVSITAMSVGNWLKSDEAKQTQPTKTGREFIRAYSRAFAGRYNRAKHSMCSDCVDIMDKVIKGTIEEMKRIFKDEEILL